MTDEKQYKVLVAEDESDIRMITEMVLGAKGYDVVTAKDGQEAWELYQEQRQGLSVLLTDFNMPRMNGDELVKKIREDNPNFPIVAYTGRVENVESLKQAGADYIFEKPFENKVVVETVGKALGINEQKKE